MLAGAANGAQAAQEQGREGAVMQAGEPMSSFSGTAPLKPQLRLAVLGDSDSHAFHDSVALHAGTSQVRGGKHQAST